MKQKKWLLTAIPLAFLFVILFSMAYPASEAAPIPVSYIDETSDTPHSANAESVTNAVGGQLTAGFWYADGMISSGPLTTNGNVILILTDNCVFTVTGTGITVPAGSSLTIYPQSRGVSMGKLYSPVVLTGGSLKNVANIEYTTNAVKIDSGGPVTNYGTIRGTSATGYTIYSTVAVNVYNNATAFSTGNILPAGWGVYVGAGSTVENSGMIKRTNLDTSRATVFTGNNSIVVNKTGATIENTGACVYVGTGCTIQNYGLLNGTAEYGGNGVTGTSSTVINEAGGTIRAAGYGYAVHSMGTGFTVTNHGSITGLGTVVYNGGTSGGTVNNYGTISSKDGVGVSADNATVNNHGLIESGGYGVYSSKNSTINNYGTISGISTTGDGNGIMYLTCTVNNFATGIIKGGGSAIDATGGTVNNFGTIDGGTYGIAGRTAAAVTVTNDGIIKGSILGILASNNSPFTLTNNKTIDGGVTLSNAANNVTFRAGSEIKGNFSIGTGSSSLRFTGTPGPSLIYATVTGTSASIGNNTTMVYIDGTALPPLHTGDILTLISIKNTGTTTTLPKNPASETVGGYVVEIKIENRDLIAKIAAVNYAIEVTDTDTGGPLGAHNPYTFADAIVGYAPQTPLDVTVTNIGTNATGSLSVSLSGAGAASFTLSKTAIGSLAAGAYDTFTVQPNAGLACGTYTATVTVGPDAGNPNPITPISFEISFTVTPMASKTTLTSDLNPSDYGQIVIFTATVTAPPPGSGIPTGNVTFYIGGTPVSTVPLEPTGRAHYTTSTLTVGNHTVTAEYSGGPCYKGSVSSVLVQTVLSTTVKDFFINAIADAGSTIYPGGTVEVPAGASPTFRFSAKTGYAVSAVLVDGVPLTREQVELGYYTFRNVNSNHTIEVRSVAAIVLEITIHTGDGRADYSMNGRGFRTYTETVILPSRSFISLEAFAADGYDFKEWKRETIVYSSANISFDDVISDLRLDLYFIGGTGDDEGVNIWCWVLAAIALLAVLGFLWWFLFYYRRRYDVIKVESPIMRIIGDDKVRRKRAYHFTIEGEVPGDIHYSIGHKEDAEWKMIAPDQNGEYVVPKKEVVNDITITYR